jgi:hypothetical protein
MRIIALFILLPVSMSAMADWPYRSIKIECQSELIEVIDYSAYNEEGQARLNEPGVINVDKLSTWRHTANDLNVPDKPLPYKKVCKVGTRTYSIVLNNASTGGYSPPNPVVSIIDITIPNKPDVLIDKFELTDMPEEETKFIVSKKYPKGIFIKNGKAMPNKAPQPTSALSRLLG